MRMDGLSLPDAMRKLSGGEPWEAPQKLNSGQRRANAGHVASEPEPPKATDREVASYDYTDADGNLIFQVVRYEPKTFRQRKPAKGGGWTWKLEGVRRVLYNLPAVAKADFVWVVEGEKDANAINAMRQCATTNAGGAKKWEQQYTDALTGKDIILCGDNDEPGREHVALVQEALKNAARSIRVVTVPEPHKDISDFLAAGEKPAHQMLKLLEIAEATEPLHRGAVIPVKTMAELERSYSTFTKQSTLVSLHLGAWLPAFNFSVRTLVPGDLVCILADTGVGKTMILQNIAISTGLPTLLFEVELPGTLTFERFAGMATRTRGTGVFDAYREADGVPWRDTHKLDHIAVCCESRLSPADIERIIEGAGIKTGNRPVVVLIDYIQLIRGGSKNRYENMSLVAEELKVIAKQTNTIIVVASQIARKEGQEIGLHDGKDSGSIENSSGLVLGAWRDPDDRDRLMLKVCKNTKGRSGFTVACRIFDSMLITQEAEEEEPSRI
jgi:5S rRNA maturation endonuclease (ribonuclease M5)